MSGFGRFFFILNVLVTPFMEWINIQPVAITDVDVLRTISIQTFIDTYGAVNTPENLEQHIITHFSTEQLLKELQDETILYYFAWFDQQVAGFLRLNTGHSQTELKGERSLEIERIYVLKAFQGKKIGKLFCDKAVSVARDRGFDFVWLGVWEENPKAMGFYENYGFKAFGRHIFKLGDDDQQDILMKFQVL